jgi:hypothetical protein
MRATKATRVSTFHNDYQRVEPGPPYPSAGLPRDTSPASMGGPHTIPMSSVKYSVVSTNSATIEAT